MYIYVYMYVCVICCDSLVFALQVCEVEEQRRLLQESAERMVSFLEQARCLREASEFREEVIHPRYFNIYYIRYMISYIILYYITIYCIMMLYDIFML